MKKILSAIILGFVFLTEPGLWVVTLVLFGAIQVARLLGVNL